MTKKLIILKINNIKKLLVARFLDLKGKVYIKHYTIFKVGIELGKLEIGTQIPLDHKRSWNNDIQ